MKRFIALLLLTSAVWYGFHMANPPAPKSVEAPETEFSAARAFEHVQNLSRAPHPLGTPEHENVREYIVRTLEGMGVDPEIHSGIASSRYFGGAAHARNIFARIEGSDPENTVMLMAHYDSVPNSPGAADDGSGVAAILETVRALQAGDAPKNNVWILLTDGEESGLLGAEYFVDHHPGAGEVDLVLNVEARGSSGSSFMFETSTPNRSLIPHFARAAPYPAANSLIYTFYQMLPNDTDLSVTRDAGLGGLNFAFAEDHLNYHTMQDNAQNLSLSSLQHHGENLLPVTRYFAGRSFDLTSGGEMVYFNGLGGGLAHYPASWSFPLAMALAAGFLLYLVFLLRTGRLGVGRWLGSSALFLLLVAAGAAITRYGWNFIAGLHPQYQWLNQGEVYPHAWYLVAFSALMLLLLVALFGWMQKRWGGETPLSGAFTVWIVLGGVTAWYLPTASYLFTWPALLGLAGWIALGDSVTERSWRTLGFLFLGLLAALYMVPPYIQFIQTMMTTGMLFVSMSLLLLLGGLCWGLLHYICGGEEKRWAAGLLLVSLIAFGGASLHSGFDEEHKKQNSLLYLSDLDRGEAWWMSRDPAPDSWTRQFLGEDPARGTPGDFTDTGGRGEPMHTSARYVPGDTVAVEILKFAADSGRTHLNVRSPNGIMLHMVRTDGGNFHNLRIAGSVVGEDERESLQRLVYYGNLSEGVDIRFSALAGDSLGIAFEVLKPGFPPSLEEAYRPREPFMMPVSNGATDATMLRRTLLLAPGGSD